MSKDSYIHKVLPGSPGGPLLFTLPRHRRRREPVRRRSARELLPGATIVSPRGDVSEYGAARFFRRTGEGVYDMDDLARAHRQDGGFRPRPCRGAQSRRRSLGLGYSNGANILASVLFADPALFDAARADASADPVRA